LEGGPPSFSPRFTGADLLRNVCRRPLGFDYGTLALCGARFHALRLPNDLVTPAGQATARTRRPTTPEPQRVAACTARVWADPLSLATTQGVSLISFPRGTEMFHFPRLPSTCLCVQQAMTPHYRRRVAPFGNPRINGHSTPSRGLSQSFTPFFGSRCQGIHRVPLLS
jgi:hypothetical protein